MHDVWWGDVVECEYTEEVAIRLPGKEAWHRESKRTGCLDFGA